MAKDFIRRLRDAFLVFDPEDKANVERYLIASGTDWNSCLLSNSDFILKRVKRRIPPPDELLPLVKFLFEKYGPLRCSRTNLPLFDEQANQAAANVEQILSRALATRTLYVTSLRIMLPLV